MSIKNIIKKLIPSPILLSFQKIHWIIEKNRRKRLEPKLIKAQPALHRKAVEKLRAKQSPINVVFFAISDAAWKYDVLYNMMVADTRFNPTILACPTVNYGKENMIKKMDKCYNLFKNRGYNVIRSYNVETDTYVDVRKDLSPDIIFYCNPYEGLIDDRYFIKKFTDVLTVYAPYYILESSPASFPYTFDLILHNLVWKYYLEYPLFQKYAIASSRCKGRNTVVTGYPGADRFIKKGEQFSDVWKIKDKKIKRIIWAPHHTITDYAFVTYSTFLDYYKFMLAMAHKYEGQIQIAFKPHPLLKNRLELMWGQQKTNEYYNKWASLPNGMLNDSAYEDMFMTSDAIIHDCATFIGEYLFTKKPAMFLSNGRSFDTQYNEFAQKCLENYYIGKNKNDIENFIVNLINEIDSLKGKREKFYEEVLVAPNGKLASENIIEDIINELRPSHL